MHERKLAGKRAGQKKFTKNFARPMDIAVEVGKIDGSEGEMDITFDEYPNTGRK